MSNDILNIRKSILSIIEERTTQTGAGKLREKYNEKHFSIEQKGTWIFRKSVCPASFKKVLSNRLFEFLTLFLECLEKQLSEGTLDVFFRECSEACHKDRKTSGCFNTQLIYLLFFGLYRYQYDQVSRYILCDYETRITDNHTSLFDQLVDNTDLDKMLSELPDIISKQHSNTAKVEENNIQLGSPVVIQDEAERLCPDQTNNISGLSPVITAIDRMFHRFNVFEHMLLALELKPMLENIRSLEQNLCFLRNNNPESRHIFIVVDSFIAMLKQSLKKLDIEAVSPAPGTAFNKHLHECYNSDCVSESDIISEVVADGYQKTIYQQNTLTKNSDNNYVAVSGSSRSCIVMPIVMVAKARYEHE